MPDHQNCTCCCEYALKRTWLKTKPPLPGMKIDSPVWKTYVAETSIFAPTLLPPVGGHCDAPPLQLVIGLQVVVPAGEVSVRLIEPGISPRRGRLHVRHHRA